MQAQAAATSKTNIKGSKRRLRFWLIFVLCFLSWAGVTIWGQFPKLHEKRIAVTELQQQLAEATKVNEQTKKELARLHDDEYLEQIIRRDFHYMKNGETPLSVSK